MATKWYYEHITPALVHKRGLERVVYSGKTPHQKVKVIDSIPFGRCLILDGKTQSSSRDEFIYHEALVHPSLVTHPRPEVVLIAGGGEGATLREALAHSSIRQVLMVDIDKQVVEICQRYLPQWNQGAFEDPRASLIFGDARKFLASTPLKFDAIILDLADPIEGGPAALLYTKEFYTLARERLTEGGVLCTQAGPASWGMYKGFLAIVNTLKEVFPRVYPYQVEVPSFGSLWGFALASLRHPLPTPEEIDRRIAQRLTRPLRFYDGEAHQGLFSLPKNLRQELEKENRVITDAEPLIVF